MHMKTHLWTKKCPMNGKVGGETERDFRYPNAHHKWPQHERKNSSEASAQQFKTPPIQLSPSPSSPGYRRKLQNWVGKKDRNPEWDLTASLAADGYIWGNYVCSPCSKDSYDGRSLKKNPNEWARRKKLVWKRDKVFLTPERTTSQPQRSGSWATRWKLTSPICPAVPRAQDAPCPKTADPSQMFVNPLSTPAGNGRMVPGHRDLTQDWKSEIRRIVSQTHGRSVRLCGLNT